MAPEAIARTLPHRFPFLLIDRVEELSPGERGRGIKEVTGGELLGPGQAMPSLLILEAGAQLLGLVASAAAGAEEEKPSVGYLAAVEEFRVFRSVAAGDRLELEVVLGRRFGPLLQGEIRAQVAGEPVAEGRLTVVSGGGPRADG